MLRQFVLAPPRGCAQRFWPFRRARLSTDRGRAAAVLTLRLYRILLRLAREQLAADGKDDDHDVNSVVPPPESVVLLQPPLRASDWGASRYQPIPTARDARDILRLWGQWLCHDPRDDPGLRAWLWAEVLRDDDAGGGEDEMDDDDDDESHRVPSLWVTPGQLVEAVRGTFRAAPPPSTTTNAWALAAVRALQHQRELQRRTSVSVERGIRVVATTRCVLFFMRACAVGRKNFTDAGGVCSLVGCFSHEPILRSLFGSWALYSTASWGRRT